MINIFKNSNKVVDTKLPTTILHDKTKLIDKLQQHFSEEEQKLYVANLFLYLNYHPVDDFVVNLENVWKFIGFANKANAKRLLKQHFTENKDYKIALIRWDERKNEGGYNQETIMLNINTFKKLCLKSNTDNSDKIHDYYIKLEMVYNELIKEQLEEKEQLLQQKEQELIKYKQKTYEEIHKNNHVYVIKTDGGYKIGKTKDINNRIRGLQTGNVKDIEVVLDFKTSNSDLLEKIVHYILDRYRCNSNREFFDCDIDYIRNVITVLGYTVDTLKSTYQHISKDDLIIKLQENVNIDRNNLPEYTVTQNCIEPNRISTFYYWLDENIIYKENAILKSTDVVELFLGKPMGNKKKEINKYKKEIEKFIKGKFKDVKWEWGKVRLEDSKTTTGWKHLCISEDEN